MQRFIILFLILISSPIILSGQAQNQTDGNGKKQGKWIKTYAHGGIRYTGQFRNNKPFGEFIYFYEDGSLQATTIYSDDGVIAETKTFHLNGAPMAAGNYIRQKKSGTWRYYSDVDSSLMAEENYKMGILHGKSYNFYPETGKPTEIVVYEEGKKEGPYFKFFPDGSTMTEGTYRNDKLDGDFTLYFPNGNIQLKGQYKEGTQVGNWNYYDEEGNALEEEEFKTNN